MTNTAAELLASKPNVLLDFDGPICSVFGGVGADWVAAELRQRLGVADEHSLDTCDPLDILRHAATEGEREAAEAERELTKLEVEAVASATPTFGAAELLQVLAQRQQRVVIVSNNSTAAVRAYLVAHGLATYVSAVSARDDADPALLKPSRHLVQQAILDLDTTAEHCVMIGDSVADIKAAQAASVAIIAYANKSRKRAQFLHHKPNMITPDLRSLT